MLRLDSGHREARTFIGIRLVDRWQERRTNDHIRDADVNLLRLRRWGENFKKWIAFTHSYGPPSHSC